MRDLLPNEQTLRDYIQGKILETYRASGFERISTPMLEDMENLDKSDGGDNLNLIFKVLKRGDKLTAALNSGDPKELSDMGLRYDLTLPLSRFYAANKDKLPHPFKVIQTDRVFRAERPQKGRLREFVPRPAGHRLRRLHRQHQRPPHPARDAGEHGLCR